MTSSLAIGGPMAFVLSLFLIATPFVAYYSQTAVMYTITPTGCDAATYTNQSSWYTGPWVIIPSYGVCPTLTYSYSQIAGYAYQDCIAFSDKSRWETLDKENAEAGYDSDMSEGATVWARSDELLIVGTVCLFLIPFAIIGLGSGEDDENLLVLFTLLAAVPVALFATLKMFLSVQNTDQVEPEAWGLVMFATCNVTVKTTYGLYVVMYVIAVCGMLTLTSYGLLSLYGIKECRKRNAARVEANARNRDNNNNNGSGSGSGSSGNVTRNPLLVSRSWTYTRNPLSGDRDSSLTGSRGGEFEHLLPDGKIRGDVDGGEESEYTRGKDKGEERVYQTAIEYLVDGDGSDSYPLPAAPATTILRGF